MKKLAQFIKKSVYVSLIIVGILATGKITNYFWPRTIYADNPVAIEQVSQEVIAERVRVLQDKVLAELAGCETKGVKEPTAAIIFDSNNQASIGEYQWQIKSVQHYAGDISRTEAIKIAIDHEEATELTRKVLFYTKDGYKNWLTCATKLNLKGKVDLINQI